MGGRNAGRWSQLAACAPQRCDPDPRAGLLGADIVLIFVRIPAAYTAWSLIGLAIFGLYTVVDFNRLRRAGTEEAIPLAAAIFLDVLNIFLLFLRLFAHSS